MHENVFVQIISLKAINFSGARFELAGVNCVYTIDRVGFASLCCDLYTTFLDELEKAFESTGLVYSQIDAVFALGESQNNYRIREFIVENFSGKVQFEQTDAEQRNFAIMEKWQMYEQLARQHGFQTRSGSVRALSGTANALN